MELFKPFEDDKRTRKQFYDDWCASQANLARADALLDELKKKFNSTSKAYDQMVASNNKLAGQMRVELEKNVEHSATIETLREKEMRQWTELKQLKESKFITFTQIKAHFDHGIKEHKKEFPLAVQDCKRGIKAIESVVLPLMDRVYAQVTSSRSFFQS